MCLKWARVPYKRNNDTYTLDNSGSLLITVLVKNILWDSLWFLDNSFLSTNTSIVSVLQMKTQLNIFFEEFIYLLIKEKSIKFKKNKYISGP
jgi:hypothetical protein